MLHLIDVERPEVVKLVSWAASNGDRSENGDYIYGKRRLREIDRRIRFLTKRLDLAEIVDSSKQENIDQVFFGATVDYASEDGEAHTVTIVGVDEVDLDHGRVSWISPIARALLKAKIGDTVTLHTPAGLQPIDILDVAISAAGYGVVGGHSGQLRSAFATITKKGAASGAFQYCGYCQML